MPVIGLEILNNLFKPSRENAQQKITPAQIKSSLGMADQHEMMEESESDHYGAE